MSAHADSHAAHDHAAHAHADHAHGRPHGDPHDDAHGDPHDDAHAHGTMKDYLTGFALSVVLTAIPFWIVWGDVFRNPVTAAVVVMVFAVAQIFVHMVYFLHMNPRAEGGWNLLAAIFTIVIVVIALAGSMWIMSHLHHNMTPQGQHHATDQPIPANPAKE